MCTLFLFPLTISVCYSFLLESTPNPNSEVLLTDKHYYSLLDMITQLQGQLTEEIHYRRQLTQVVVHLQGELVQSTQQIADLKNKSDLFEWDFQQIKTDYTTLKTENRQQQQRYEQFIKQDFANAQSEIIQLKNELVNLKRRTLQDQQELVLAENKTQHFIQEIQSTNSKVDILMAEGTARTDDFLALYNKTLTSEQKITSLETNFAILQTGHNESVRELSTKIKRIESDFYSLNNSFIIQYRHLESKLENEILQLVSDQSSTERKLSSAVKQIEKENEKVAMTACANAHHTYPSGGEVITFPDVRSSIGINNVNNFKSSGYFICENTGLYMFAAHIMSNTFDAQYNIFKNGNFIARVYIRPDLSTADKHTGSGVVVLELNDNDMVYIQTGYSNMFVHGAQCSCLTVIKIK